MQVPATKKARRVRPSLLHRRAAAGVANAADLPYIRLWPKADMALVRSIRMVFGLPPKSYPVNAKGLLLAQSGQALLLDE